MGESDPPLPPGTDSENDSPPEVQSELEAEPDSQTCLGNDVEMALDLLGPGEWQEELSFSIEWRVVHLIVNRSIQ